MLGGLIYTQKQSGDWGNLGLPLSPEQDPLHYHA